MNTLINFIINNADTLYFWLEGILIFSVETFLLLSLFLINRKEQTK